ncbi:DUF3494 domain-containing protein [Spirosoma aureum]|uniref:DUF3494 domain-containing protein n=1 Tax=Spirosoma aureum TaxID=2692134 RepID=A0A6G9AGU4_9BACT|nr:ice-binding family protein [Spirosoma aureum]QIP11692.1 DUF3494 domain-containing protein [Spirosoma aureum]
MIKNLLLTCLSVTLLSTVSASFGQAPNLGTAATFALFTANGAFTNSGASLVTGDIGTNVGAFSGFPSPGTVIGNIRLPTSPEAAQAAIDVVAAYNSLTPAVCGTTIPAELSSLTLTAGISCQNLADPTTLNGTLTLSGPGIFIIKLNSALTTATNSTILLTNGATANNVFFQINGAATLGTGSTFKGTILATGAIVLATQASLEGRGLSTAGAITLNNNNVTVTGNVLLPDLTPIINLPSNNFTTSGADLVKNFTMGIYEVAGQPTSSGNIVFTITAPFGYTLAFNSSLTSIDVSGGSTIAVNNTNWAVTSNNGLQLTLTIKPGQFIAASPGNSIIGFTITRTVANSNGTANITVNVADDASKTYDNNPANNIYARNINAL